MFNISSYLEKFSKKINSDQDQKEQILKTPEKFVGFSFSPKDIEIKNYTMYIKSTPAVMNKVFIYKNGILEEIARLLPGIKIIDIR